MNKTSDALIWFGSQTGRALRVARSLHRALMQQGVQAKLVCGNRFDSDNSLEVLRQEPRCPVIVVTSTFGHGHAPDNATRLEDFLVWSALQGDAETPESSAYSSAANSENNDDVPLAWNEVSALLNERRFAVMTLGHSMWPSFCAFGRLCDARLHGLGAQRMLPLCELDAVHTTKQNEMQQLEWQNQVCRMFPTSPAVSIESACTPSTCQLCSSPSPSSLDIEDMMQHESDSEAAPAPGTLSDTLEQAVLRSSSNVALCEFDARQHSPPNSVEAMLVSSDTVAHDVLRLRLRLATPQSVGVPGGHVSLFTANAVADVRAVLAEFRVEASDTLSTQVDHVRSRHRKRVDAHDGDHLAELIATVGSAELWKVLAFGVCLRRPLSAHVRNIIFDHGVPSSEAVEGSSVLDVLREWPGVLRRRVTLPKLLSMLPPMRARDFSFVAPPSRTHFDLLVRLHSGGVCSRRLAALSQLRPRPLLHLRLHPTGHFRLPENVNRPFVFIGCGTGVAPLHAMLTQLQQAHAKDQMRLRTRRQLTSLRAALFAGFRERGNGEWLLKAEIKRLASFLSVAKFAFGRADPEIVAWNNEADSPSLDPAVLNQIPLRRYGGRYVQDAIRASQAKLNTAEWLLDPSCMIVVCGSAAAEQSVRNALLQVVGSEVLSRMRQECRYLFEAWN